jgi:CheY-like chemotaxis protein
MAQRILLVDDDPHIVRLLKSYLEQAGMTTLIAYCKTWVEAMGGPIGVESTQGQGSRFRFALPFAQAAK